MSDQTENTFTDELDNFTGSCLCGEIKYRSVNPPYNTGYCHCSSCRHHTGAPVAAYVDFSPDQIQWPSGNRERYESSPGVFRAFCRECGTSLTWEGRHSNRDWIEFHIGTLDRPNNFPPQKHSHSSERIPWLGLSDESN